MKAVVMERYGAPDDVLKLTDVAKPAPKAGEVLVRVLAASINEMDWGMVRGAPFVVRMLNGLFTPKVQIIDVGRIQSGQKLLLNGAGGGVGTFALQLAKLYDVEVTVVDKPGKLDMLRAMGADHVIDYLKEDFTQGGKGYDLILDVQTNRSPFA